MVYPCRRDCDQLSDALNGLLVNRASVDQAQLDNLYTAHVAPSNFAEKIDVAGTRVRKEIEVVLVEIDVAARQTAVYAATLQDGSSRFAADLSPAESLEVIETLLRSTIEVGAKNKELERRLTASGAEIKRLQDDLETVRADSLNDPLTGLGNRKRFDQAIADAIEHAKRNSTPFCVLADDVDHFKRINDRFGHSVGDQALRHVAISLNESVREDDIVCRYGGEEFAVILPGATLDEAGMVAERIRQAIAQRRLVRRSTGERIDTLTISIGVAMFRAGDTALSLYDRADTCLYAAKRDGRNRVVREGDRTLDE